MSRLVAGSSFAVLLLACGSIGCSPAPGPAELILLGGKIVTLDPARPEASALAAADGRILAVGSDEEIERLSGPETRVIRLAGELAIPGFIESHGHFTGVGRARMVLDLRSARSWQEIVVRAAEAAQQAGPGRWIVGWGWHQEKWDRLPETTVEGYPTHDELSRAVPDNPVLLRHAAGSHAGLINAAAMRELGLDDSSADPAGGRMTRDAAGRLTGVLHEAAFDRANAVWEAAQKEHLREEIRLADEECLAKGITTFQDAGSTFETIDVMREMAEAGEVGVRLWVMVEDETDRLAERLADYRDEGAADEHLTVRAIKKEIDGALGAHSAWLLEPYSDLPGQTGINTTPLDDMERAARLAVEHDFQLCVHAIGDRGNRETLDLYERIFAEFGAGAERRWRIEHAQHLSPEDIPRFAELGVIASMQAIHCTSDGPWVPQRIGERRAREGAYVWRSLLDSGAIVCNGTDAPVEDVDPIPNFFASVTRRMSNGEAFYPEQRMTRMEALRSYTLDAARAAFQEQLKGSLAPGKLADVVVLSEDLLVVPDDRILDARVLYTIVGGEVAFEAPGP
jgi:predicted amidohydrolase YtcJ